MNPEEQRDWSAIIFHSAYTLGAVIKIFGLNRSCVRKWELGTVKPNKKNMAKMIEAMTVVQKTPRLERHKSFGYATPDQIEILFRGGVSPDRDAVLLAVKRQSELEGKYFI